MDELAFEAEQAMARWATVHDETTAWEARALVDRISRAGQGDLAVRVGEQALTVWPDFAPLRAAVAWALYRRDIAPVRSAIDRSEVRARAKAALARIAELTAAEPYGQFSAWPLAVLELARAALDRWPNDALALLGQLDPDRLDPVGKGQLPSLRSRWFLATSNALEQLNRWEELCGVCTRAVDSPGVSAQALAWIRRRHARALLRLDRPDESAAILEQLRGLLTDWWLEADLARAYAGAGRARDALEAARRALAGPGKLALKWRTVALLAELLAATDRPLAAQHARLARALRDEQGWPPDHDLERIATALGVDGPPVRPPLGELSLFWSQAGTTGVRTGVVKTLLPGAKSGFITAEDGSDIYFALPRGSPGAAPPAGTPVRFRVVNGFDRKKNRPSLRAVEVRPAD